MKTHKKAMWQIDRYELVDAILASELLNDADMNNTLVKLYTSMVLKAQKQGRFISQISISSSDCKEILQYIEKSKMALG